MMVRKALLAALTAATLFLPMDVLAAGTGTHDAAAVQLRFNNVIARPDISGSQVRCMQRVYKKVSSMGGDYYEAFGTACGLCHVSC